MGGLLALLAALGYTSRAVLTRKGLMEDSPGNIWEINFIITLVLLFIFLIGIAISTLWGFNILKELNNLTLFAVLLLILDGALGPLIGGLLMTVAFAQIGASHASALRGGSNPFFATIFAIILLGENINLMEIIGVLLIIGGIMFAGYRKHEGIEILFPKTKIAGGIFALLGGLAYALSQIARGAAINLGATPNTALIVGISTALVIMTINCLIKSGNFKFVTQINRKSFSYYAFAGLGSLIGRYAFLSSFTFIPVWQAAAIRNIQPLLAILLTWLFLKKVEKINIKIILAAILVTLGVIFVNIW